MPLSYGSSQLTRVNVSIHYSRHTVVYGDKEDTSFTGLDYDDPAFANFGIGPGRGE